MDILSPVSPVTPILIADCGHATRVSFRLRLEEAGYKDRVAEAAAVAHAAAYLHFARLPHIVVLDFLLPPGTAEPMLHLIGLDVSLQRHRYILTSNRPMDQFTRDLQNLIAVLCSTVLYKPYAIEDLLGAVRHVDAETSLQLPTISQIPLQK